MILKAEEKIVLRVLRTDDLGSKVATKTTVTCIISIFSFQKLLFCNKSLALVASKMPNIEPDSIKAFIYLFSFSCWLVCIYMKKKSVQIHTFLINRAPKKGARRIWSWR